MVGADGGCVGKVMVDVEVAVRSGSGVIDGNTAGDVFCPAQAERVMHISVKIKISFFISLIVSTQR